MVIEKANLVEKFSRFNDLWSPKIIGEVDNYHVKIVKVQGEFVWHQHDDEDELFYVMQGRLTIELREQADIVLGPGEFAVIPKGIEHRPIAESETHILLFERQGTLNTGDVQDERTVTDPERL
jgi:mannose-6-phosphate isomerase-like protein (cupin superfamily)